MQLKTLFNLFISLHFFLLLTPLPAFEDEGLQKAFRLFQQGKYAKAITQYEKAARKKSLAFKAHLGLAQVFMEKGEYAKAEVSIQNALAISPDHPDALNLSGDILKLTGRYTKAKSNYQNVLQLHPNHLAARLNLGIMQWEWGEKSKARQTLQYFISYYRSYPRLSAKELNLIAQACVYLDRFSDANNLFYDATKSDPQLWQAFIAWGNLFLSKYNISDATGVFEDALKINPNAAEAHLGLARCWQQSNFEKAMQAAKKALAINPNLIAAHNLLAEFELAAGDFKSALKKLEIPFKLNPNALSTRTLRALCFYFLKDTQKFAAEETKILAINPKYGDLYFKLAEIHAKRYLFKESVEYYRKALALNPEHWAARAGLGTSLSRLGQEKAAKAELEQAFAKDPYNKYIGNLLTLFDEFPQYQTHKTPNFTVRIHKRDDAVLSKYAIALAQESYSELTKKYAFNNTNPFIVEIFPEHDDFAVRCFGLPGAQAFLGICFGNVVAMDSPRARTKGDFVWGETLWHELVHVSHLRLTDNRIPRWLAEGIAVYETSTAKPYWNMNLDIPFIMAFKSKSILPLKDLDSGFNRPRSPGQVTLSYFQASKVVEFIVKKYGRQKLLQTFPEFKSGMDTQAVIKDIFGKDIEAFDAEFKQFIMAKYNLKQVD
ncbi:MAG: tetratricopeptide repeat protein, partial [bacterium]